MHGALHAIMKGNRRAMKAKAEKMAIPPKTGDLRIAVGQLGDRCHVYVWKSCRIPDTLFPKFSAAPLRLLSRRDEARENSFPSFLAAHW